MKKRTTITQAEHLRQAIRHRQDQEKQELRQIGPYGWPDEFVNVH